MTVEERLAALEARVAELEARLEGLSEAEQIIARAQLRAAGGRHLRPV